MRQLLVVAAVIINGDKVLLAQRYSDDSEGGKWEFPGGKIEPGEDPRKALHRELMEELGVRADVGEVLDVISEVKNDLQLILLYFKCTIVQGDPRALECQQVSWWQQREVKNLTKPPADQQFWEKFYSLI